ncbi:hypothetical protein D3C80_1721620 [compost metagenome]
MGNDLLSVRSNHFFEMRFIFTLETIHINEVVDYIDLLLNIEVSQCFFFQVVRYSCNRRRLVHGEGYYRRIGLVTAYEGNICTMQCGNIR